MKQDWVLNITGFICFVFFSISCLISVLRFESIPNAMNSIEINKVKYKVDNKCITEYYDEDGRLVTASDKGYARIIEIYDDSGKLTEEWYYNNLQEPVSLSSGQFGLKRRYDEYGRNSIITYLDREGNPFTNKWGFVSVEREFDEAGRIISERYLDGEDNPIPSVGGNYGVKYCLDDKGRQSIIIYVGIDGKPCDNQNGSAIINRTYTDDGSILSESYFNSDGTPAAISWGKYGFMNINGVNVALNKTGQISMTLDNLFSLWPWVVFVIGVFLCFLFTRTRLRRVKIIYCLLYLLFIFGQTVLLRKSGRAIVYEPFCTYRQFLSSYDTRMEILNNIWLFIPIGACVYTLFGKKKYILSLFILSCFIEGAQFVLGRGVCEFDDILSNTVGGVMGYMFGYAINAISFRHP